MLPPMHCSSCRRWCCTSWATYSVPRDLPPARGWVLTAAQGPKWAVTFGRAELAGVDATVVLMYRGEQQLAFAAIEMHLAFE